MSKLKHLNRTKKSGFERDSMELTLTSSRIPQQIFPNTFSGRGVSLMKNGLIPLPSRRRLVHVDNDAESKVREFIKPL